MAGTCVVPRTALKVYKPADQLVGYSSSLGIPPSASAVLGGFIHGCTYTSAQFLPEPYQPRAPRHDMYKNRATIMGPSTQSARASTDDQHLPAPRHPSRSIPAAN